MANKAIKVNDVNHLRELSKSEDPDFFIVLLSGGLISRKRIAIIKDEKEPTYDVYNFIDDSEQTITEKELFDSSVTNIGEALNKGALFFEGEGKETWR
ncbi:MAG: hypothetical protein HZB80_01760 [Deltaproteobacteria bacterium]|nr:hypothetical protein [Deltaproteobacteria bacterium]